MLMLQILILLVLFGIFAQDMAERAVFWWIFPVLILLFMWWNVLHHVSWLETLYAAGANLLLLIFQYSLLTLYFSIKYKRLVNLLDGMIGLADLLFLICLTVYLPVLNFLLFYMASLMAIVILWLCWIKISARGDKQLPLAGLQAGLLAIILLMDWWLIPFNATNDNWLYTLLNR